MSKILRPLTGAYRVKPNRIRQLCKQAGHPTEYVNVSASTKLPKGQAQCHCLCGAKVVVVELPVPTQPGATIGGSHA